MGGSYNAVWAERWDDGEDCAAGRCRDLGAADTPDGALALVASHQRRARLEGWPGRGYVTDAEGRMIEAALM